MEIGRSEVPSEKKVVVLYIQYNCQMKKEDQRQIEGGDTGTTPPLGLKEILLTR